jgi:hypothetical protein
MGLVLGTIYVIGLLAVVVVSRARVGLTQLGRMSGATVLGSLPWFVTQIAAMLFWPIFLGVWLARGRPETPWEVVTAPRSGSLRVRRRTDR